MSKTPNYDSAVAKILADLKPGERVCALTGEKWLMTDEEIGWYKKFNVPPSLRSPLARMRILSGFLNGFQWWWHRHAETGQLLLSYVHPTSGLKVLPDQEWLAKDFSSQGREYSAAKPFFEQFRQLQTAVPMKAAGNLIEPERSMTIASFGDIDSYFVSDSKTRDCFFALSAANSERSAEIHNVLQAVDSYHIDNAFNTNRSQYIRDARDILDSSFGFNVYDCADCFGAASRKHKKYLFFNEQLSAEEYKKRRTAIDLGRRSVAEEWKEKFNAFLSKETIWPQNLSVFERNSTGEYLVRVRNCRMCYACVHYCSNLYWSAFGGNQARDSAFLMAGGWLSNTYASVAINKSANCSFSYFLSHCQNLEYCFQCLNCENCFGCVGLQRKNFYIFNKPYSQTEYWQRLDELKCAMLERGEYGEFFPLGFSPVYFLQSASAMYWLSGEKEAKQLGAAIYAPSSADAIGEDRIDTSNARSAAEIPDSIDDIGDEWCGVPIRDEALGRYFTFLKPEIALYRKLRVAPPNKHFIRRIAEMIQEANSAVFEEKKCDKCGKTMIVSINKTFPEKKIYCTECFKKYFEEVS